MKISKQQLRKIIQEEIQYAEEVPEVQDDQRARELLDAFRDMLKPNEREIPGACGTFLRQLADMSDRETEAQSGNMPGSGVDQAAVNEHWLDTSKIKRKSYGLPEWAEKIGNAFGGAPTTHPPSGRPAIGFDYQHSGYDLGDRIKPLLDKHRAEGVTVDATGTEMFDYYLVAPA